MPAELNVTSITVSCIGDRTQEKWFGQFQVKTRLSHRDHMLRDKLRRELLGGHAEAASERAVSTSEIFSQLAVRIVEAPTWWKAADNGLELIDDNVIADVYTAAMKAEADAIEALSKKAEEAKKALEQIQQQNK